MSKYARIQSDLITASEEDDATFPVNTTLEFKREAEKVICCFCNIKFLAYSLQTRMYKLCSCRQDLDALLAECQSGHTNPESDWYQRKLPGTYISAESSKLPDPQFVLGIIKIQMDQVLHLTGPEK